jgi:acyl-coenzyme A synthetase/AMP-(fatty) acid ligase
MDRFDVWEWAELIRRYKPRRIGAPPATVKMILDQKIPKAYFESADSFYAASAPLDLAISDEFEQTYGIPVLRGYGATEFLGGVTSFSLEDYRRVGREKRGSVGRAMPGVSLRVVDPTTGEVLPPRSEGLLEVLPQRRPAGASEGWMRTTDLASLDEDGYRGSMVAPTTRSSAAASRSRPTRWRRPSASTRPCWKQPSSGFRIHAWERSRPRLSCSIPPRMSPPRTT